MFKKLKEFWNKLVGKKEDPIKPLDGMISILDAINKNQSKAIAEIIRSKKKSKKSKKRSKKK